VRSHSFSAASPLTFRSADLQSLHLERVNLVDLAIQTCFPSLASLTLTYTTVSSSTLCLLLAEDALPALRALAFTARFASELATEQTFAVLVSCVLDRLEILQLHAEDHGQTPPALFHSHFPTFLTVRERFDFPNAWNVTRLRFTPLPGESYAIKSARLYTLADLVRTSPSLRSIHLPTTLNLPPYSPRPSDPSHEIDAVSDVELTCRARSVEIVWFAADEEDEYSLSPSCWAYARLKRRMAAATTAADGA
jgi:hypothetical protein